MSNESDKTENLAPYPVMLSPAALAKRGVLVVGGGVVAERKVKGLLAAGANVILIAPAVTEGLRQLAAQGAIKWLARPFQLGDMAAYLLVFAATNSREVNQQVGQVAVEQGCLVNYADDPASCDFTVPSVVRRGPINISISTFALQPETGQISSSPALAAHLRRLIEGAIGPEYGVLASWLEKLRPQVQARVKPERRAALWQAILDSDILELLKAGRDDEAARLAQDLIAAANVGEETE
jgi:precorrin-2 dehydrogenase / sirohydrochlorin ferrochelatase